MIEVDALAVRRPLRLRDDARYIKLRDLTCLPTVRRNNPEVRRFEQPAVRKERDVFPVRREDGIFIFDRSVSDLFRLATLVRNKIHMVPFWVLENGGQGLAIGRPDSATNGPSASPIDRSGVKRGGFTDGLARVRVELQQIRATAEIFFLPRDVDDLIAIGRPASISGFFLCRGKNARHGSVRADDEKAVDAAPSTLKENPASLWGPAGCAVGCLTRIAASCRCIRKTVRSPARCGHNPNATLARIGKLPTIGRPGQAGFATLSARERDGPSPSRRKQDNLPRSGQGDGLAIGGERIVADRLEGEQVLQCEMSGRLRLKASREYANKSGHRETAEELTKNMHFSYFPCLQS